ncbi:hypothetical protein [Actinokineospora sp.]|uniref:hypothetical protein n=1 Tax=Actinokineospora sp. TaxID=1872133 RepID=UPI003D6A8A33
MSEGFACKTNDLNLGQEAILRNANHVGRMAEYGAGLRPSSGAFSPIASNFEGAYVKTVETQIVVLGQMREKLTIVSQAVEACKAAYVAADEANAQLIDELLSELNMIKIDLGIH